MVAAWAVHAALLALPGCWADRSDARKPAQLEVIAVAVAEASNSLDDAAALLAIGFNESRFCLRVHSGADRGPGRGIWQLEGQGQRHKGPFVGLDLPATENAARVALFAWRHSFQCGHGLAERFTAYAARPCGTDWPTRGRRASTYWYTRSVMARALTE